MVVALALAATARLFVWPDSDTPVRSDAVVVLGGGGAPPDREAVALVRSGIAPLLVVSGFAGQYCPPRLDGVALRCFVADPYSTRGEARAIATLAARLHWHRIVVVVPTPQATRARLRIGRCYHGQLLVHGVSPGPLWVWAGRVVYEWGALLKALVLQPGC